ncbi:hypothetical protein CLV63_102318 [Murinocardiopsis flavida]|uniref:ARB-07466-like C-terminal domain-containing protein n=1 Tax=Murinocardiopsis flavida TaxID=645275 RepID=A0A2P8DSK8_9ACTN|nr:hypothetical protein [Murinocardiopsis flavida]PSL00191.1 hypothetical protein CLV63_102318 [Murinocardiopsis flavida]
MGTDRGRVRTRTTVVLVVLALLAGGCYLGGPWLARQAGLDSTALPWGAECSVAPRDGAEAVALSRDDAKRATTAVALDARGADGAPDTSELPKAALTLLAEGPPDAPGPVLSCRTATADGLDVQQERESGLTPRAENVRTAMAEVFGRQSLGGFEPGGVADGHGERSAHYEGRAVDVFYRPVSEENRRDGWLLAHWLVAHADELDVEYVIFDDRIWGAQFSQAGWRDYTSADTGNDILQHRDHVHVDVLRGG